MKKLYLLLFILTFLASCASNQNISREYSILKPQKDTILERPLYSNLSDKNISGQKVTKIRKESQSITMSHNNNETEAVQNNDEIPAISMLNLGSEKKNKPKIKRRKRLYRPMNDSLKINKIRYESNSLHVRLSLPHVNMFLLKPENEPVKNHTGFWGLSFGFDYGYEKNRFISVSAGGVVDFFLPVPAAVDIEGEHELMTSTYLMFTDNIEYEDFTVGYGFTYAKNEWRYSYTPHYVDPELEDEYDAEMLKANSRRRAYNVIGFSFPLYCKIGNSMNLGVIYRPTFIRFLDKNSFDYEHVISIDFGWVIGIF